MGFTFGLAISNCILMGLLGIFVVSYFLRKDDEVEARRKLAIDAHSRLQDMGLSWMAGTAKCYAVGDYSGGLKQLIEGFKFLQDSNLTEDHFRRVLHKMLEYFLRNKEDYVKITDLVKNAKRPEGVPNGAPAAPLAA